MPADDYTPTTEQVRRAYVTGMRQVFIASAGEHSAEFDRFLASVRREAARDLVDALCWEGVTGKQHTFLSDYMSARYLEEPQ